MSMPYGLLYKRALDFVPYTTIKPKNTWIAILVHSISCVTDIKEKTDFLWIKCHGRITIRTLKHEYFARHPIEDFEFKFIDSFPGDTAQVKHLREHQLMHNGTDHQVLVLRVFEEHAVDEEEELEEDNRIAAKIRDEAERGSTGENAIVIDDGENDFDKQANGNIDGDDQLSNTSIAALQSPSCETTAEKSEERSLAQAIVQEECNPDDEANCRDNADTHEEFNNSTFDEAMEMTQDWKWDNANTTEEHYASVNDMMDICNSLLCEPAESLLALEEEPRTTSFNGTAQLSKPENSSNSGNMDLDATADSPMSGSSDGLTPPTSGSQHSAEDDSPHLRAKFTFLGAQFEAEEEAGNSKGCSYINEDQDDNPTKDAGTN